MTAATDTVPQSGPPLSGAEILQNARALAARVHDKDLASEYDRLRRLPEDIVAEIRAAGVMRMNMPRIWGGPEMTAMEQVEVIEALARADASIAWCSFIWCDSGIYSGYLDDSVAREMYPRLDMATSGWVYPVAPAHRVDGGYRVSGQWMFGSGSNHCDWLVAGCVVFENDAPVIDENGRPMWRILMAPRDSYEILDNWYTTGLRGTGSNDYRCEDLFVPEERSFSLFEPAKRKGTIWARPDHFLRAMRQPRETRGRIRARELLGVIPASCSTVRDEADGRSPCRRGRPGQSLSSQANERGHVRRLWFALMYRFIHAHCVCAAILLVSTPTALASTIQDEGLWFMLAGQGGGEPLAQGLRDFRWWLDIQPRLSNEADGLGQMLVRPGLGYAFADNATVWLGYAWIQTERNGVNGTEHRIWQQLMWSPKIESFGLSSRTRLEQRFDDAGDDLGWRLRQFVKATKAVPALPRLYLSVYDEVFFDLNDTDWGQRSGFSQNRFFVGPGWKFDAKGSISAEVGYLNQFTPKTPGPDRMNHILSINLFTNF